MSDRKERLTVTVNPDVIRAGNAAVAQGRSDSLSAWVNDALRERVAKEDRLAALRGAVDAYEAEFGAITPQELVAQERADRARAVVVRPAPSRPRSGNTTAKRVAERGQALDKSRRRKGGAV
jgi:Arc/MetJ-type ribon-helix-helix transcriptional regulator